MAQSMTSQANVVISQVHAMNAQVNRKVGPRMTPHACTMTSHLRDFTRFNPLMFFG